MAGEVLGSPKDGTHPDVADSPDPATRGRLANEVQSEGSKESLTGGHDLTAPVRLPERPPGDADPQ